MLESTLDKEINYMTGTKSTFTLEQIQSHIKRITNDPNRHDFAICLQGTDEIIGELAIVDINEEDKKAGFRIAMNSIGLTGKGYGTEAIKLVLRFVFEQLKLNRLQLGYPSIELLIKLSDIFDISLDELVKEDNSLKEKLIKDSRKLSYPKWKLFFDILLMIGFLIILAKIFIIIGNKLFDLNIVFLQDSLLLQVGPFFMTIIAAIGSESLAKKYK
ncbi:transcriptional regulator with XRE-family HTH domain [Priestia taiwanensis]|nr:transcriptional regulator with XRE-family HTH domain [Priestia taiwanensis]